MKCKGATAGFGVRDGARRGAGGAPDVDSAGPDLAFQFRPCLTDDQATSAVRSLRLSLRDPVTKVDPRAEVDPPHASAHITLYETELHQKRNPAVREIPPAVR